MSWKEAKTRVLHCLEEGDYVHYQRDDVDVKNLLATGKITALEVFELLKRARGTDHSEDILHNKRSTAVHIVRRRGWYVKWFFVGSGTMFMSVHPDEH